MREYVSGLVVRLKRKDGWALAQRPLMTDHHIVARHEQGKPVASVVRRALRVALPGAR
jgi:hypothetical protein